MNTNSTLRQEELLTGSISPSGSYLQTERFHNRSERYVVLPPKDVATRLDAFGFKPISLLTGRSRTVEREHFQRTISRFRDPQDLGFDDLHVDIIYISKHMGRGQDELRLGLYRGLCANQWTAGTMISTIKIRHTGNAWRDLEEGIVKIVAERERFVKIVKAMKETTLTFQQAIDLAKGFLDTRLEKVNSPIVPSNVATLLNAHRPEDQATDLFTIMNVVQENVVRFPVSYAIETLDKNGNKAIRNQSTRRLKESSGSLVNLNAALFDKAFAFLPEEVRAELEVA